MFERSKASLGKVEASLQQAIAGVRSKTSAVRLEVERIDAGVLASIDRVQAVIEKAKREAESELGKVRAKVAALLPEGP